MMKNLLLSFALIAFLAVGVKAQTASVKLVVDITYQLTTQISGTTIEQVSYSTQKFNPREDILDVAGSFNGWDGSNSLLSPVEGSDSTLWEITIPDLTVGEFIAFKIRIKGEWVEGHSEFWGDAPDRKYLVKDGENNYEAIFDNYYPGMVPVTVNVNMNARIAAGTFDAATQSVDLAGTFNEWDQTNLGYDDGYMFDNKYNQATDGIYRKVIIAPVGTMKWKARIHDASAIEWESRSDREFTVVDTVGGATNEITVWV
jgi:1,4-alpha-glucan branching enzyme